MLCNSCQLYCLLSLLPYSLLILDCLEFFFWRNRNLSGAGRGGGHPQAERIGGRGSDGGRAGCTRRPRVRERMSGSGESSEGWRAWVAGTGGAGERGGRPWLPWRGLWSVSIVGVRLPSRVGWVWGESVALHGVCSGGDRARDGRGARGSRGPSIAAHAPECLGGGRGALWQPGRARGMALWQVDLQGYESQGGARPSQLWGQETA